MATSIERARAARKPLTAVERPTYVSASETRKLLALGASMRAERLRAADMLSISAAAKVSGQPATTLKAWIAEGRALALSSRHGIRLPGWQFAPAIWHALPQLSRALNTAEPWRLLSFLESPLGALEGLSPRQSIEQHGLERVLALAAEEA